MGKEPFSMRLVHFVNRHRNAFYLCSYVFVLSIVGLVIIEPTLIFALLGNSNTPDNSAMDNDSELDPVVYFLPRPTVETLAKHLDLPLVPKEFVCEQMFEQAGITFKYPEIYWDHADAFKSALSLYNKIEQASATEHSWFLMEMGKLPFVRTVCETGFNAGHNSFHWLVSQEDVVVHSFDFGNESYTDEIANFLSIEFPDRFYFYRGDPKMTVPRFFKKEGKEVKCDIMFISNTLDDVTIETLLNEFGKMAHPLENLVVVDTHPKSGNSSVFRHWEQAVRNKILSEIFRCYFETFEDQYHNNNQRGFLVGSFVPVSKKDQP